MDEVGDDDLLGGYVVGSAKGFEGLFAIETVVEDELGYELSAGYVVIHHSFLPSWFRVGAFVSMRIGLYKGSQGTLNSFPFQGTDYGESS